MVKKKRWIWRKACIVPIVMILTTAVFSLAAFACTSILVTPGASVDGSASVTHTCDSGSSPFQIWKVPAKDWEPGSMVDVLNLPQYSNGYQLHEVAMNPTGNKIPQVPHTYGYIMALFGVINEKQVGIGETTIGGRREFRNPNGFFDITNLSVLAMERASSAREAVQIMGDLAVKYGYKDNGEELSISDPKECWVFEIVGPGPLWEQGSEEPGAFWVAQRVPDGHVAVSANSAIIGNIDFDDHENFMYGPGIREFAAEKGWWDPASGKPLNWRWDFNGAVRTDYSYRRVCEVFRRVAPSLASKLSEADPPFSVPAERKLSIQDICALQRDHYEDTQFDMRTSITAGPWGNPRRYQPQTWKVGDQTYAWNRMISSVQCEYTITTQSRGWLPDEIGALVWYGAANPDATCYVPLYASMTEINPIMNTEAGSQQQFTRKSYWWAISAVSTYADLKYSYMIKDINAWQEKYEGAAFKSQAAIEAAALNLYKQDPKLAVEFLTRYCNRNVEVVRDAWWELLDYLIWKYNAGFMIEDGKVKTIGYPESWLQRVIQLDEPDHYKK